MCCAKKKVRQKKHIKSKKEKGRAQSFCFSKSFTFKKRKRDARPFYFFALRQAKLFIKKKTGGRKAIKKKQAALPKHSDVSCFYFYKSFTFKKEVSFPAEFIKK